MGRLRPSFLPYRCTRKVALQGHGLFSELPNPNPELSPKIFAIVQLLSHVRLFTAMAVACPGSPVLHYLLEFAQIHVH